MKFYTSIFTFFFVLSIFGSFLQSTSIAEADSRKEFRIKRCMERQNNAGKWQKLHYAFALNKDGDHCGWAWGHTKKKYAIPAALRGCNRKSKNSKCKIVYVK